MKKVLLYITAGFLGLTIVSMLIRQFSIEESINLPFLIAIGVIGYLLYLCIKSANKSKEVILELSPSVLRAEDYLVKSGKIEVETLLEENDAIYQEILNDNRLDEDLKSAILTLFKPHKISMLKYALNKDFFTSLYSTEEEKKLVSPTLLLLKDNIRYKVKSYPIWFYLAFPDVVRWAVEEGWPKVKNLLGHYPEYNLYHNGYLANEHISCIVDLYLRTTKLSLEARRVN